LVTTSRERVLAAVAHKEPDRIPIDLGATPSSGISAMAYTRLKNHLGMEEGATRIYDVVQQLAQPEEMILDRFNVDAVDLGRTFNTEDACWREITTTDGSQAHYPAWFHPKQEKDGSWTAMAPDHTAIARMPTRGEFFDQTLFPYLDGYPSDFNDLKEAMGKVLWAAFAHSPWDHADEENFWTDLRQNAIDLSRSSDRAILVVCGCNLFEWGTFLRRMDNFLMDLMIDPENVASLLDALMDIHLGTLEKVCDAVGDIAHILRFGDDLGMNEGLLMPPDIYRRLFKPRHKRLCDYVKKHSRMHTFLHSCGGISEVMPDLIEAGYDIINPVQTCCRKMEPAYLKEEFGREITFWGGGCDTRSMLNRGNPAEVKAHVIDRLEILSHGGGFVFATEHNILADVPPDNIVAMYAAIDAFHA